MTPAVQQRLAVSALIELVRPMIDSSFVSPGLATKLTSTIAAIERAFAKPRLVQVGDHTAEEYDRTLDVVQEIVGADRG